MPINFSLIENLPDRDGRRCGYCGTSSTNFSDDIWAHTLTIQDYQDLIDRGWRRCGKACYKPMMDKTCCPHYTIRCDALNIQLSKSQKKIIKRTNKFLVDGKKSQKDESETPADVAAVGDFHGEVVDITGVPTFDSSSLKTEENEVSDFGKCADKTPSKPGRLSADKTPSKPEEPSETKSSDSSKPAEKNPTRGTGPDPSKPVQRKAKLLRLERKQKKMAERGLEFEVTKPKNEPKSLEDFLEVPKEGKHKFELRLVRSHPASPEFNRSFDAEYLLYRKYQIVIHKDDPDRLTPNSFRRFLVESPFIAVNNFGSYHQQYWLDGNLIAVAVVDILPHCVSSVYFFYDVDYSFLSLGTYSSFREVELVRTLNRFYPDLKYYYMGFYIHTCPKMRYKANIRPSFILCPVIYSWHPTDDAIPKIDRSPYTRINDDTSAVAKDSDVNVNKVLIFNNNRRCTFAEYLESTKNYDDITEVELYSQLVGSKLSQRMAFYR